MSILLALLCLAVVGVSAWLRLAGAGLGCTPWPACYAGFLEGAAYTLPMGGRMVHRIVATSALLVAFYVCWCSYRPVLLRPVARQALLLTGLMLLLSVVGIWSNDPRRVTVNFVNLLGGLALVVFSWWLVLATRNESLKLGNLLRDPLWLVGVLALSGTVLMGGLIGASYQATACTAVFDCVNSLHVLHRLCAVAAVVLLGWAAGREMMKTPGNPARQRLAGWVISMLVLEALLGAATVSSGYALELAIAHNLGAAALLAAVMQLVAMSPATKANQAAA